MAFVTVPMATPVKHVNVFVVSTMIPVVMVSIVPIAEIACVVNVSALVGHIRKRFTGSFVSVITFRANDKMDSYVRVVANVSVVRYVIARMVGVVPLAIVSQRITLVVLLKTIRYCVPDMVNAFVVSVSVRKRKPVDVLENFAKSVQLVVRDAKSSEIVFNVKYMERDQCQ